MIESAQRSAVMEIESVLVIAERIVDPVTMVHIVATDYLARMRTYGIPLPLVIRALWFAGSPFYPGVIINQKPHVSVLEKLLEEYNCPKTSSRIVPTIFAEAVL